MKIKTTKEHRLIAQKAITRTKKITMVVAALVGVQLLAGNISSEVDQYIQFADAQEELMVSENEQETLNSNGKFVTADHEVDEIQMDTLDVEHSIMRRILGAKKTVKKEPNLSACKTN